MSPTLQEAIKALKPYMGKIPAVKPVDIVKSLSGKFKSALRKGESSAKIIRSMRNSCYGRI